MTMSSMTARLLQEGLGGRINVSWLISSSFSLISYLTWHCRSRMCRGYPGGLLQSIFCPKPRLLESLPPSSRDIGILQQSCGQVWRLSANRSEYRMGRGVLARPDKQLVGQVEGLDHRSDILPRLQDLDFCCWSLGEPKPIWRSGSRRLWRRYSSYRCMERGYVSSPERRDCCWQWVWVAPLPSHYHKDMSPTIDQVRLLSSFPLLLKKLEASLSSFG